MPKVINPAIGTCVCPVCGDEAAVKRFNVRALVATRARRGGRLYVECKRHGAFTSAASEMQEWILERAVIWGPEGEPARVAATASETVPVKKPTPPPPVPERGAFEPPDQPLDRSKHGGWGFFS